jgi:4-hydroxybenzoate polyprenyltransferase
MTTKSFPSIQEQGTTKNEVAPVGLLRNWIALCRPQQWSKNVFVLAPLLFSESVLRNTGQAVQALAAFVCFCLASSAVYVLNDWFDVESDRAHPRKRHRPLASGSVTATGAIGLIALLLVGEAGLAWTALPPPFWLIGGLYLVNSLLYCTWLKHHVIVDVMVIAIGFVLRLLAGCAAIDVIPSSWILVCGFSLALVLGFGKRRTEVESLDRGTEYRPALQSYNAAKLDTLLAIATAVCLISYIFFTVAPDTIARHETSNLVYSVPFVAYGLFRYLFKVQEGKGDGPVDILLKDPIFAVNAVLWVACIVVLLYLI